MSSSENEEPDSDTPNPNQGPPAPAAGLEDYDLEYPCALSHNFYPFFPPYDVTANGNEGQTGERNVNNDYYDDDDDERDNDEDENNLRLIEAELCDTIDGAGDEDLSVFSDEVQQAFERSFGQANNNNAADDEDETIQQMNEAERFMLREYRRANAPRYPFINPFDMNDPQYSFVGPFSSNDQQYQFVEVFPPIDPPYQPQHDYTGSTLNPDAQVFQPRF